LRKEQSLRISSGEFVRNFSQFCDTAVREPIVITKNGRERLILMSIDEYNFLLETIEDYNVLCNTIEKYNDLRDLIKKKEKTQKR